MIVDKQTLKSWQGIVLGYIETDNVGNKIVRDSYGKVLGRYDKRADITRDLYGRVVAKGDQCTMLIGLNNK